MGSFNTYSMSTRSCALVNNVPSGFPILERLISSNGALCSFIEQALRSTASVQEIQVAFPLNLSRQFFNIIFV